VLKTLIDFDMTYLGIDHVCTYVGQLSNLFEWSRKPSEEVKIRFKANYEIYVPNNFSKPKRGEDEASKNPAERDHRI
jgi:hypothetical protein